MPDSRSSTDSQQHWHFLLCLLLEHWRTTAWDQRIFILRNFQARKPSARSVRLWSARFRCPFATIFAWHSRIPSVWRSSAGAAFSWQESSCLIGSGQRRWSTWWKTLSFLPLHRAAITKRRGVLALIVAAVGGGGLILAHGRDWTSAYSPVLGADCPVAALIVSAIRWRGKERSRYHPRCLTMPALAAAWTLTQGANWSSLRSSRHQSAGCARKATPRHACSDHSLPSLLCRRCQCDSNCSSGNATPISRFIQGYPRIVLTVTYPWISLYKSG